MCSGWDVIERALKVTKYYIKSIERHLRTQKKLHKDTNIRAPILKQEKHILKQFEENEQAD